jgi:hypothetical protein
MIFPKIVRMNNNPKQVVKKPAVKQVSKVQVTKPRGCGCGGNKWKLT